MTFRDEILKKYHEQSKEKLELRDKNKQLAIQVLMFAKKRLEEAATQGKLACVMDFTRTREAGINSWQDVQGSEKELPALAIKEGIDFIHCPFTTDHSGPRFIFSIIEYPDDYMLKLLKKQTPSIDIHDIYYQYFQKEREFITICRNIDKLEKIPFEVPSKENKEKYTLFDDAMNNAFYRLGYEEAKPTYSSYLTDDLFNDNNYIFFQQVRNCVEISHHINKQKHL